jgi:hypothetical protein
MQLKGRLFGLVLFLVFVGMIAYNWYLLINEGYFYVKMSGVAPFGALGGLLIMAFPQMAGRPDPKDKKRNTLVVIVMVILGLALGGVNFYLMKTYR